MRIARFVLDSDPQYGIVEGEEGARHASMMRQPERW